MSETTLEHQAIEQSPDTRRRGRSKNLKAEQIARDLSLIDEIDVYARSLPNRRAEAGLGSMPDDIREMAYEEREAALR